MLQSKFDLNPKSSSDIYGNSKERTASFRWLRKALAETGIAADHYLFPEIDEVFRRRDWLAHRIFLEVSDSRQSTREFQILGLEELIAKANRLFQVLYAVARHVAEKLGEVQSFPAEHLVSRLTAPYLKEAADIFDSMIIEQNNSESEP